MRQVIKKVFDLTEEIARVLDGQQSFNEREVSIDKINHLIERRAYYIKQITPPYTSTEIEIGKQIVALNERIALAMLSFQNDIQLEIQQMKKTKQSSESYINPYKDIRMVDGIYVDQKK